MSDIFGPIRSGDDLENDVVTCLSSWWPVLRKEFELQHNIPVGSLPDPKSFTTAERLDRENADNLPAVVVVSPGMTSNRPKQQGDGTFRCFFAVGVGVFVAAAKRKDTKRLVRQYSAIARTIMLQRAVDFADNITWIDESFDDVLKFTDEQTFGVGYAVFEVEVSDVVNRFGGPADDAQPDPGTQPGSDWPTAEQVNVNVTVEGTG